MESDSEFWREQRRGTIGCGLLVLVVATIPAALLFFFAPSWAFWVAVVPLALFALLMLLSAVRELRRTSVFLYESSGSWRTGAPARRSLAEIESVWSELENRQRTLAETTLQALSQGIKNPHVLGDVVAAMEEQLQPGEEGYWVSVNVLNHYQAELNNLRTLLRQLMPVEPPEGTILEEMEQWLSQLIAEAEELRRSHVFGEQKMSFVAELASLIARQQSPSAIEEAIFPLRTSRANDI